ncbi:NPL6 [Sanghuangporus weigelae]
MKRSGTKIIIKPRRSRQPQPDSEHEENLSEAVASEQADSEAANDEEVPAESDAPEESVKDEDDGDVEGDADDAESDIPVERPVTRGRPRGRPRLSAAGPPRIGTGRPRGRPRGSGRGRARGRGRGEVLTLRLPKRGDGSDVDNDNESSQAGAGGDEGGEVELSVPTRKVLPAIEGDAYITEDDPKGDTKIDANGNLLGGRTFKSQTFILPGRHPERRYMLAIDAARTSGFRDSLYYFRRNPFALKLIANQIEKDYLIEIGKLGGHLRTRSVTLVTARSAFKLHGAKMLIDGRIGIDDYYEEKAIQEAEARGLKAGDYASELLEQQQAGTADASGAGSGKIERSGLGLYRTGGPTTVFGGSGLGPYSDGPLNVAKKAMLTREGATDENWMSVMAQRTREANSEWLRGRLQSVRGVEVPDEDDEDAMTSRSKRIRRDANAPSYGVYEPHTAIVHYESSTQPTRARWEVLPDSRNVLGGTKVGNGAWGVAWVDTVMEPTEPIFEEERARACQAILQSL